MNKEDALELLHLVFPWAYYLARDNNGEWYIYASKPKCDDNIWLPVDGVSNIAFKLEKNTIKCHVHWTFSLTKLRK